MNRVTEPLVTVYVANHNYERYIQKAIESVLEQSMQDFELIIIDDGSTDNSQDIIIRYESHPKVRIVLQDNKGLNRTANIALHAARGKYIMRLDADDYLDPQALLVMSDMLEKDPALGLVFPDYYYVDDNGRITGQERRFNFSSDVTLLDQPAHGACTLIRTSFLLGIGGYSEEYRCQDGYDLWLRFCEKHSVRNVNLPLFYYRRHGANLTSNNGLILETRAEIKKAHTVRSGKPDLETIAVITVRGKRIDYGSVSLEKVGGTPLLNWTIDAALAANKVKEVVVSTPDEEVLRHVTDWYGSRVHLHERPVSLARENVSLVNTVDDILDSLQVQESSEAIMVLSDETPFRSASFVDTAIDTMQIFDVDSVIPIIPENDLFYRNNGSGLEAVGHESESVGMRYERNYIYRKVPGMTLTKKGFFNRTHQGVGGVIGHVTYDRRAAFVVRSAWDVEVANIWVEREVQEGGK